MKRVFFWLAAMYAANCSSQSFSLVKDINTTHSSSSIRFTNNSGSYFTELNGALFFGRTTPASGAELWKADESTGKAGIVKDIRPGIKSGSPQYMTVFNGALYFSADDGISGYELWRSDGTDQGTRLLKDIAPGAATGYPQGFIVYNDLLYFSANGQLWKTDGTEAGTQVVANIRPGKGDFQGPFVLMKGIIYFPATDSAHGRELWRSDGTTDGTYMLRDIYPGSDFYGNPNSSRPQNLVMCNGILYFSATDGENGNELWRSDGTASGTWLLKDIYPGIGASNPLATCAVLNNKLYFTASGDSPGPSLWVTDGTTVGTVIISGAYQSMPDAVIGKILPLKGELFMVLGSTQGGSSLWRTDGAGSGTVMVTSLLSGPGIPNVVSDTNQLYFTAEDPGSGAELWVSDGTAAGTKLVKDIEPGALGSYPGLLQCVNGWVYFAAQTSLYGLSIWKTDGTTAGTMIFMSLPGETNSSDPQYLTALGNDLYFSAYDSTHGAELWRSDGTATGTSMVRDITPGAGSTNTTNLTACNDLLFFRIASELWRTDGSEAGTVEVHPGLAVNDQKLLAWNGTLYFFGTDKPSGAGAEIWKTVGGEAGAMPIRDLSALGLYSPGELTVFKGSLFFVASNVNLRSRQLWKVDSTTSSMTLVRTMCQGNCDGYLFSLTVAGNYLYFVGSESTYGEELWKTDGTPAGTTVLDIVPGSVGSLPDPLMAVNGELYFTAKDALHGVELWKTDGTPAGTMMMKDINPGPSGTDIINVMAVDGMLFFDADDGIHGGELWRSDGTPAGTRLVQDTWAGPQGNGELYPWIFYKRIAANGKLITTRNNGIDGEEPWISDGTDAGTMMIQDIVPGSGGSAPDHYTLVGDKLFFTATTPAYGTELWVGDMNNLFPKFKLTLTGRLDRHDAVLDWTTFNEMGLKAFDMQRSLDNQFFMQIGSTTPKGGVGLNASYQFREANVNLLGSPDLYYRLALRDTLGGITYSETIHLVTEFVTGNTLKYWPNPVDREMDITLTLTQPDHLTMKLYDPLGRVTRVWDYNCGRGTTTKVLYLADLPPGVYYLEVKGRTLHQLIKILRL